MRDVNLDNLGRVVRARRIELGLTQSSLGSRVGFYQERISALENGRYGLPSLPALQQLAEALEMDLAALLGAIGFEAGGSARVTLDAEEYGLNAETDRLSDQIGELYRQLNDTVAQLSTARDLRLLMRQHRLELEQSVERCRQAAEHI